MAKPGLVSLRLSVRVALVGQGEWSGDRLGYPSAQVSLWLKRPVAAGGTD